jgi:hypothetical protein
MYLHRGIVIHSFCPTGYYFLLVSLGITQDLLTHVCYRNVLSAKQVMYVWHRVCRHGHYLRFAHPCYRNVYRNVLSR